MQNFCSDCGEKLKMRYPGDDPENGPARPSCSVGHLTVQDRIDWVLGMDLPKLIGVARLNAIEGRDYSQLKITRLLYADVVENLTYAQTLVESTKWKIQMENEAAELDVLSGQ